jgi:hypothetical protein
MPKVPGPLALALLLAGCAATPPPATGPQVPEADLQAAQEIMQLEERWGQALSRRDTAFFGRILGDEFVTTGGEAVKSKAEVIRELGGGTGPLAAPRLQSTRIKVYGNVAVVTGLVTFGDNGVPGSPLTRFTEVWVKRAGAWQAVHGHYNPIGAKAGP